MQLDLKPGTYVVAVSGGVDSMVLLHMLATARQPGAALKLIVAHFDHGIRSDSAEDRRVVQTTVEAYGLPFAYDEGRLGSETSEATARQARYRFLRRVQQVSGAQAIVTAHHQDDLLETALINLLRGTGRKGLTALSDRPGLARPLLDTPKRALIDYAHAHRLQWREDSTNQDETYLRNYVRRRLVPRFDEQARVRLLEIIKRQQKLNHELDHALVNQLHLQTLAGTLDRQWFTGLPHAVAREVLATWLRSHELRDFDRKSLERLVVAAKVARPGSCFPVLKGWDLQLGRQKLALIGHER